MEHNEDYKVATMKAVIAWIAAIGSSLWQTWSSVPWDKFAQFAAFIYSVLLIIDYIRKRLQVLAEDVEHDTE